MIDNVQFDAVTSAEAIAAMEKALADPDLNTETRMALDLMLMVSRTFLPWLSDMIDKAREDATMQPLIMNAVCNVAAGIYGNAGKHMMAMNQESFSFMMNRFASNLAAIVDLHVELDEDEPVAIADRPKAN